MYLYRFHLFWLSNEAIVRLILFFILQSCQLISSLEEYCDDVKCSNINDYVCGATEAIDGTVTVKKYQNICHMRKMRCRMQNIRYIRQVPDKLCGIKKKYYRSGRRVNDFGIVGAHQVCNHTCPTYCVDTYEPVCAQIWKNSDTSTLRPMINHCHVDLFSCAVGVNVTITTLNTCFKNPTALTFMTHMAAMKSLRLLGDQPYDKSHRKFFAQRRRTYTPNIYTNDFGKLLRNTMEKIMDYSRDNFK